MRAVESLREGSYFYGKDVLAPYLAGKDFMAQSRLEASIFAPPSENTLNPVAMRALSIDDRIISCTELHQVVVLGAGMDSRPYRLVLPEIEWYEADMPHIIEEKEKILTALESDKTKLRVKSLHRVAFNAKFDIKELFRALERSGYNSSEPTLFLMEGVLMYLTLSDVKNIFQALPKVKGSRVIGSVISSNRYILTNPLFVRLITWMFPFYTAHKVAQLWRNDIFTLLESSSFEPWIVEKNVNIGEEQLRLRGLHLPKFPDNVLLPNMRKSPENLLDLVYLGD